MSEYLFRLGFLLSFKEGNRVFQPSRKGSTHMSHLRATVPFKDGAQRKGNISRQLFAIFGELEFPNAGPSPIPHIHHLTYSQLWLHGWLYQMNTGREFSPKHHDGCLCLARILGGTVPQPWLQGSTSHRIHLDLAMCSF